LRFLAWTKEPLEYGTLFGSAIGGTAGQGVTYGLNKQSGAVVANLGPIYKLLDLAKLPAGTHQVFMLLPGAAATANLATAEQ
jgi:hypothetical protein